MPAQFLHASHLDVLQPEKRKKYLEQAIDSLQHEDFDSIVCCGVSGLVFAPHVAMALNKYLIVVRKASDILDARHSMLWTEGYCDTKRYIIIDDLVSSGATIRYILEQMKHFSGGNAKCVLAYQYIQNIKTEGRYWEPYREEVLETAQVAKWGESN